MDIEFHYYVNFIVAMAAGFSKENSYKIAYSSQFTDDNTKSLNVSMGNLSYYNQISHTYDLLIKTNIRDQIYQSFHFLPGNNSNYPKLTTANSRNSQELLSFTLQSDNPYLIGIASHAYADTWAHQNFYGRNDSFNSQSGLIETLMPNIGHADAFDKPDLVGLIWQDSRFGLEIDNSQRFLDSALCLYDHYVTNLKRQKIASIVEKSSLKTMLKYCFGKSSPSYTKILAGRKKRLKRYCEVCTVEFNLKLLPYEPDSWFEEELDSNFINNWVLFQEAVRFFSEHTNYRLQLDQS